MNILDHANQQREKLVFEHFTELVKAPNGDLARVGQLSDALNDPHSLQMMVEFLLRHPQGQRAFEERPRLGTVNLQQLHQLPPNTLGYLYANHMIKNGLAPLAAREIAEDDYSFLEAHLTETHDIWHIVTDFQTDILGEIQLQAFYVAQIHPIPLFLALIAKNLLKTALENLEFSEPLMEAVTRGWTLGKQAKPLFGIHWNKLWEKPIDELRGELNLNGV